MSATSRSAKKPPNVSLSVTVHDIFRCQLVLKMVLIFIFILGRFWKREFQKIRSTNMLLRRLTLVRERIECQRFLRSPVLDFLFHGSKSYLNLVLLFCISLGASVSRYTQKIEEMRKSKLLLPRLKTTCPHLSLICYQYH